MFINLFFNLKQTVAHNYQINFVDPASPIMEGLVSFHHDLFFFLVFILVLVSKIFYDCLIKFNKENFTNKNQENNKQKIAIVTHHSEIEIIWTVIPALILLFIVIPSFSLLYSIDEVIDPLLTIKIIGHQWYWTYEYTDLKYPTLIKKSVSEEALTQFLNKAPINVETIDSFNYDSLKQKFSFNYDSYMLKDSQIIYLRDRLIKVDNAVYMPINTSIRLLITSTDVLHSWAIPSLGVKLDSCPGRLNETATIINRPGNFFGQCSEICGINHGFMPINLIGVNNNLLFNNFLNTLDLDNIFISQKSKSNGLWQNYMFISYVRSIVTSS